MTLDFTEVLCNFGSHKPGTAAYALKMNGDWLPGARTKEDVTIDAAVGTTDTTQTYKKTTAGLTAGLAGGAVSVAQGVYGSARRVSEVKDGRLSALYAAQSAYLVSDALGGQLGPMTASQKGTDPGIALQIGIGGSSVSNKAMTHDETSYGSRIRSQGDIAIAATGGDLNIIGSAVDGKNVALAAANNINLLSQRETHSQQSDSKNSSGGVGAQIGGDGVGFYAEASASSGKTRGNGVTHAETTINAGNTLTLISGNDTTIKGAQLAGNQVIAAIGGNLRIESEQDTDDYASKNTQVAGKLVVGAGVSGNASFNQGKMDSRYTSVNEVSGIAAGDGGFQIAVGGNTHLKGGVIASTADAQKNILNTGTLTYENLTNEAHYSASQVGVNVGNSWQQTAVATGLALAPGLSMPQNGDSSSTTQAGIAQGTIVVRDGPVDLSGLDRNPSLDNQALKGIFDEQKIREQQELSQLAGYVGMRAAGDLASQAGWKDGSPEKVALHGAVGAAIAALGGGNALQGGLGAAAGEASNQVMGNYLLSQGIDPNSETGRSIMQLGSAAIGAAAGEGSGVMTALNGQLYNHQLHPDFVEKVRGELAKQYAAEHGVSEDEARGILLRAAMSSSDGFSDRYLSKYDSPETQQAALQFLSDHNAVTPNGTLYDLYPSGGDKANASLGAWDLMNNPQAYADVRQAMNPLGDPAADKALNDYFNQVSFGDSFRNWRDESSTNFLMFNANLALAGGGAGLSAGLPLLTGARSGGTVGSLWQYALATRGGAAATSAVVNAASQLLNGQPIRWTDVGTSAITGGLTVGGNAWWSIGVNTIGGAVSTKVNNITYGERNNVLGSAFISGVAGGAGYYGGSAIGTQLGGNGHGSLYPIIIGNAFGSSVQEGVNGAINRTNSGGGK